MVQIGHKPFYKKDIWKEIGVSKRTLRRRQIKLNKLKSKK